MALSSPLCSEKMSLFYQHGNPVWAISSETVNSLLGLSLNFFFILPLTDSAGIQFLQAPVLHPMAEGSFNFVIAWTLMFAPLLYTDHKRDRYKSSLDVLWGLMMFLTNTFLIPYMALRLNDADPNEKPSKRSQLGEANDQRCTNSWSDWSYSVSNINIVVFLRSSRWRFWWNSR